MEQVLRVQINKNHSIWRYCDDICFASKNLYNFANYIVRQDFINNGKWIRYNALDKLCKVEECYKNLPAQTAQQVLRLLDKNWKSFFGANKKYKKNPENFTGRPKLPGYKDKTKGRNIVIFTSQQRKIKNGIYRFPKSDVSFALKDKRGIQVNEKNLRQVRIVPNTGVYTLEAVYRIEDAEINGARQRIMGIDLGLNNLVTITSNVGETPIVVNGRSIKSVNKYYNKKLAALKSTAMHINKAYSTNRIQKLHLDRNNKIKDLIHKASKKVVDIAVCKSIDTIVIGQNKHWKKDINIGKVNNQKFVQIPFSMLIEQLEYKANKAGIAVIVSEESYTSKASFVDGDKIPVYSRGSGDKHIFSGKRITRGLYKTKSGRLVNADVNGSYNIIKKVVPNAFLSHGIEDCGFNPVRVEL